MCDGIPHLPRATNICYDILMLNIVKGPKITWIDIKNPTQEDIQYVRQNFNFHPLVLDELRVPSRRPRVEHHDSYLFMILHYPVYSKEKREIRSRELDIIATKDTIITAHYGFILPLKALFDNCNLYEESRKTYMASHSGHLLYYILIGLWKNCLTKLDQIDVRIDEIEKKIFGGQEKEMVREISFVKTDIINFWRIIEPQQEILDSLSKEGSVFWGADVTPYFADVLGTYEQAWDTLKTHRETILAMEDTNQSLLSTKTNEIIRTLTVFSVILLPLTLLASIWGMNTQYLPFHGSVSDFWIVFGIMISITLGMAGYFRKKGWL